MRLAEIMSQPVRTIERTEDLETARERMRLHGVRHLAVVEGGRLIGLLSERELGGAAGRFEPLVGTVADRMIARPVTATPQTTVREAANLLRGHRIGALPVIDGESLKGIVTVTDLLDLLGKGTMAPSPGRKRAVLARRGPRAPQGPKLTRGAKEAGGR